MPVSKKRKKNGKKVEGGARIVVDPDKESSVTLQDLINVLAYQEYVKDGTIVAEDVNVTMADEIPVNIINEDGTKTQIGTAARSLENPERVSIDIEDPEMARMIQGPIGNFSISDVKEIDE